MENTNNCKIRVFVYSLDGKALEFNMEISDTILKLKEKIQDQ